MVKHKTHLCSYLGFDNLLCFQAGFTATLPLSAPGALQSEGGGAQARRLGAQARRQRVGAVMSSQQLMNWCVDVTRGYRNVNVVNMTSSWRSGLAFCAVIHHFRPDLM